MVVAVSVAVAVRVPIAAAVAGGDPGDGGRQDRQHPGAVHGPARGRGTLPVVTGYRLGSPTGPVPLEVIRTTTVFDAGFTGGVFVG